MQRSKYTAEFKAGAVKHVVDKGHTVVDVAARLGLGEGFCTTGFESPRALKTPLKRKRAKPAKVYLPTPKPLPPKIFVTKWGAATNRLS